MLSENLDERKLRAIARMLAEHRDIGFELRLDNNTLNQIDRDFNCVVDKTFEVLQVLILENTLRMLRLTC